LRLPLPTGDPDRDRIIALRLRLNLSQAALGRLLGTSDVAVSFWEAGQNGLSGPARKGIEALEKKLPMYYAAIEGHDISRSPWTPLNSRTLSGAMREILRKKGSVAQPHQFLVLAEVRLAAGPDGPEIDYLRLARRPMAGDSWEAGPAPDLQQSTIPYIRPTVREASQAYVAGGDYGAIIGTLMDAARTADGPALAAMLAEPPEPMESKPKMVFLAGLSHKLANDAGLPAPDWVFGPDFYMPDDEPYVDPPRITGGSRLRRLMYSPPEFAHRGYFLEPRSLRRV